MNHANKTINNSQDFYIKFAAVEDSWNKTWDNLGTGYGMDIWGNDQYLYTLGYEWASKETIVLIKWDYLGNLIWNKSWGYSSVNEGHAIYGDGTYLYTVGQTETETNGRDLVLIKWDLDGNIIWNRTWGNVNFDKGTGIWGNGSAIYTVACTTVDGFYDHVLIRWTANGDILWNKTWGGSQWDDAYGIYGLGDFLYTTGSTLSYGAIGFDLLIIKWDCYGNLIWNKTWSGPNNDYSYCITGDGSSLYIGGTSKSYTDNNGSAFLSKWSLDGAVLWNTTWGGLYEDNLSDLCINGSTIYASGASKSYEAVSYQAILLEYDISGNLIQNWSWDGPALDWGRSIWLNGSNIYGCGGTESLNPATDSLVLLKWFGIDPPNNYLPTTTTTASTTTSSTSSTPTSPDSSSTPTENTNPNIFDFPDYTKWILIVGGIIIGGSLLLIFMKKSKSKSK